MSNVLLISLRSPFLDSDRVFPPIGLMQLYSCLINANHSVTLVDDFDLDSIKNNYSEYDLVGMSVMTPQGKDANLALSLFKKHHPNTKIVIGGPHALHYFSDVENEPWDYIVPADGERAIVQIADSIGTDLKLPRVIRDQLSIVDMNNTPTPWRHSSFLSKYNYILDNRRTTTMLTTRGCPMGCKFCEDRRTIVRHYEINRVIKEIKECKEQGFDSIMFFDDIFAMVPSRTSALTTAIKPLDIKYRCFAHANTLKEEMAKQLADSGCVEVGFGCEHASQKILDVIGKGVKVRHNEEFLQRCYDHNIRVKAFFIVGLPGEDVRTLYELEEFISRHTKSGFLYDFDITVYYPYKGTYIRDNIQDFDIQISSNIDQSLGYYKGQNGTAEVYIRTSSLTQEQILEAKNHIYNTYNKRFKTKPN